MKAIRIHEHGDYDVLKIEELPDAQAGPGEVLVSIKAAGINHLDTWVRRGVPGHRFPLPITPGSDAAGVVKELGPDVPMHFTAFHPDWKMMDVPSTPTSTLIRSREIAMKNGVHYAYTGNVHDEAGESTYCHHCGEKLIGRDWYVLSTWNLDEHGACKKCGTTCAGVFESKAGTWGSRRQPVRLRDFAA